ncbi:MAG: hypothetical protein GY696_21325, partial [Gammaproteobacteria bacterium]|nr:hypothetical protein [Gammaproteobacteria bacterium]
ITTQAETESDEAEYSGGIFGWLENEQGADAQGLVNALLQSDVMPPINCLPRKGAQLERPRRYELPPITPHVTNADEAWEDLRIMGNPTPNEPNDDEELDSLCNSSLQVLDLAGGGDLIPQVQPSEREQEYVSDMEFLNGEGQLTPSAVVNQLQLMSPCPVQTEEGDAIGWDWLEKTDDAQGGELLELAEQLSTKRGCRLRAEYAGLYDQDPTLGDDPANAEINYFEEVAPRVPRKLETLPFLTDLPDEYLPWARPEDLPVLFGMLDGEPVDMMYDSGANMDIISESVYNRIARGNDSTLELVNEKEVELHSVGRKVPTLGKCKGTITYGRMTSF